MRPSSNAKSTKVKVDDGMGSSCFFRRRTLAFKCERTQCQGFIKACVNSRHLGKLCQKRHSQHTILRRYFFGRGFESHRMQNISRAFLAERSKALVSGTRDFESCVDSLFFYAPACRRSDEGGRLGRIVGYKTNAHVSLQFKYFQMVCIAAFDSMFKSGEVTVTVGETGTS